MAWSAPITWTVNQTVTSTQMNSQIRDNFLETAPAKATAAGRYFATTAANTIAERRILQAEVLTQETSTSTSYTDLATVGPSVTITTGVSGLVFISAQLESSSTGSTWASYGVTGATTSVITDIRAAFMQAGSASGGRVGVANLQALTAGSNIFKMQYRVSSGTGTFDDRRITIMGL